MALALHTDHFCRINNLNIRYWTSGNAKESIVLIHGLGGSIEAWNENIEPLSKHYTVYAIELPGHGKSDKPAVAYTLEYFSDFICQFMAAFKLPCVAMAGLSFGGAIALHFTINFPDKISRLILVSSAGLGHKMSFLFMLSNMAPLRPLFRYVPKWLYRIYAKSTVYDARSIPPWLIDYYFNLLKTKDFMSALLSIQKENFTFLGADNKHIRDVASKINTIRQKTLVIWGKNDTIIPLCNAAKATHLIADSSLTVFDHCSHNPQYEKFREFNELVLAFLGNDR